MNDFELENWLPMEPSLGPPLPRFLKIHWPPWIPWYKPHKGELVIAYVWWEGKVGWNQIFNTNNWPPNTAIITTWKVKNTGEETAVFKTRLLTVESAEAQLTPGASFTFEQPAISLSLGTHQFTLEMLADGQVVGQYPFKVIVGAE